MEDGQVKSICPSESESIESLNFKRGIMSMIQTKDEISDYLEADIYGKCVTEYSWTSDSFTKAKDLSQCGTNTDTSLLWKFGKIPTIDRSIEGKVECQAQVGFQSVKCEESRKILQPLSNEQSHVDEVLFSSFISSTLKLSDISDVVGDQLSSYSYSNMASINHMIDSAFADDVSAYDAALTILGDICKSRREIKAFGDIPQLIRALMESMEHIQADQLITLWEVAPSKCSGNLFNTS